jgi:hypothetical protein
MRYVDPIRTPADPMLVSLAYRAALYTITGMMPSSECVAILHGQYALETGHGAYCICNNPANIKATLAWINAEKMFTSIKLNEKENGIYVWYVPEGKLKPDGRTIDGESWPIPPGHPATRMRAFETLEDGIRDKIAFLNQPEWAPALKEALEGRAAGYVTAIKHRHYFTADLDAYIRSVIALAKKYLPVAKGLEDHPIGLDILQEQRLEADADAVFRFDWSWMPDRTVAPNWEAVREARDAEIVGNT